MPKPSQYSNATLNDPQLVAGLTTLLSKHVSLTLKQTHLTPADIWAVLSYAAVNRTSLDAATQELPNAPSGNRLREVVMAGLPSLTVLQGQLNRILRRQLPRRVTGGKHAYEIALDLTLIPYHGQPAASETELLRNAPKAGTTHFHGYATVAIVHHQQRYVVAFCFVEAGTKTLTIVRRLLQRVRNIGLRIKLVLLDKGFYAGEVFRTLDRCGLSYIVPLRLGKRHRLFHQRGSYRTTYRITHAHGGAYLVAVVVLKRFKRNAKRQRQAWWLGYGCGGWARHLTFQQVATRYRQRFGIETSYRQMNQVRARTTTRSPVLRLLYVGLALILVNWYVTLRRASPRRSGTRVPARRWTLRRLVFALRQGLALWFSRTLSQGHPESTPLS